MSSTASVGALELLLPSRSALRRGHSVARALCHAVTAITIDRNEPTPRTSATHSCLSTGCIVSRRSRSGLKRRWRHDLAPVSHIAGVSLDNRMAATPEHVDSRARCRRTVPGTSIRANLTRRRHSSNVSGGRSEATTHQDDLRTKPTGTCFETNDARRANLQLNPGEAFRPIAPGRRTGVNDHLAAARRGLGQRCRHRRDQRLHEVGIVGGRDVGAQAVRFEFVGDHRPDRGDRRSRRAPRAGALRSRAPAPPRPGGEPGPRLVSAMASTAPFAISSIAVTMLASAACAS